MPPEIRKLLADALDCAVAIENAVAGKELADLLGDRVLRSAVYHEFTVIGEAITKVRGIDEKVFEQIHEASKIVGFRNQVVHGYQKIDDTVTWQIIQDKLPVLKRDLERLLSS